MRWWWGPFFAFVIFIGSAQAELANGGFERISESQAPLAWSVLSDSLHVVVERGDAHSGKAAVHIVGHPQGEAVGIISDGVVVQSGALYTLTGWAQVEGGHAFAQIRWLDDNQALLSESALTTQVSMKSWAQMAGSFVAPAKATSAQVICAVAGEKAVFDEIVLRKVAESRPFELEIDTASFPAEGERASRIEVTVRDSLGALDGGVVIFEASDGQVEPWALVKDGKAEVTLHGREGHVGGAWVRVHLADARVIAYVGDEKAVRLKGLIFDASTGVPLAGRVIVTDSLGTILQTGFWGERGFLADGAFEIDVPPGKVTVSAIRGLDQLAPEPQVLQLVVGEEHAVELPFRAWVDLKSRGWLSGDLHDGPDGVTVATANGLDWAVVPVQNTDGLLVHTLTGETVENQWGNQWVLGALGGVGAGRPGFEVHARAHDNRGVAGYVDLYGKSGVTGLPFDVIAGPTFDALNVVDIDAQNIWFALLNRGYRIAGTAFSAGGGFHTYTHVVGDVSPAKLMRAIATGQNMMTNGPLLLFSAFAAGPGDRLPVGRKRRATIRAWSAADSEAYLTRIELIRNAEVVQSWVLEDQPRMHRISVALEDSVDCWYLARCYGTDSTQVALTNPIFFETEDFAPPEPVQAVVRGTIQMPDSSSAPNATVRVVGPLGKVVLETVARGGVFQVWAPATSQIQVEVPGYEVVSLSIFDHQGVQDILSAFADAPMPELKVLDQLLEQLQAVDMDFILKHKVSSRR